MSRALKEGLLRIFFSYSAEAAIKLMQGKIEGVIFRQALIRALSDISLAERSQVPVEPIKETDSLLEILDRYGIWQNGVKVLPVFNSAYELEQFWGRTEIIKAQKSVPHFAAWELPRLEKSTLGPSEAEIPLLKNEDLSAKKVVEIKVEVRRPEKAQSVSVGEKEEELPIKDKAPKSVEAKISPKKSQLPQKVKQEWEAGKLAIWALETLPFPILALDLKGHELFHNAEWEDLEKKHPMKLSCQEIYALAQKVISQKAVKSDLKVKDILELPLNFEKLKFLLRAIHVEGHTLGYLIWAMEIEKSFSLTIQKTNSEDFLGKTLPEILAEAEKKALLWAYEQADGNKSNAAMLLGIPRQTYGYRLKKYLG